MILFFTFVTATAGADAVWKNKKLHSFNSIFFRENVETLIYLQRQKREKKVFFWLWHKMGFLWSFSFCRKRKQDIEEGKG